MALSDIERKRCENALAGFLLRRRPPPEIRPQLDLGYRVAGQSVVLFETRPVWDDPTRTIELPFAKATFVRTRGHWALYWRRSDLKWHGYEPRPDVLTIEEFVAVVERDELHCFFG
jgi:hypothetical protein